MNQNSHDTFVASIRSFMFSSILHISVIGYTKQENSTASTKTTSRILQVFNWNNYIAMETIQRFEASAIVR